MKSNLIKPGNGLLFMKVGTHAQESLEEIVKRKTKEIETAGYALWGYGGNTCHPRTMVQPFARSYERRGGIIYLCMEPMESSHFADPLRAEEFSADGFTWEKIPATINALGSRYALVINKLREDDFNLSLASTQVALGRSMGTRGHRYIRGRVDKACLEVIDQESAAKDAQAARIGLVAELLKPYAVFLRSRQ